MWKMEILAVLFACGIGSTFNLAYSQRVDSKKVIGVVVGAGLRGEGSNAKYSINIDSPSPEFPQYEYQCEMTALQVQKAFQQQFKTTTDFFKYIDRKKVIVVLKNIRRPKANGAPENFFLADIVKITLDEYIETGNMGLAAERELQARRRALARLPINEQAAIQVKTYFETKFTRCGDMYESRLFGVLGESGIYYYKSPRFVMTRIFPLTEADKLNGITWSGEAEFRYSAKRVHIYDGDFERDTPWQDYEATRTFIFHVWKLGASWNVESRHPLRFNAHRKIQCITGD